MTEARPPFGQVLRRLRIAAGLTQQELAERAGISTRAISDLERGLHRVPHRDTAARIAEALPLPELERAALTVYYGAQPQDAQAGASEAPPSHISLPLTSFVGREQELIEVESLLQRARLVTLTGPGGIGKTRLAGELVHAHPHPTVFVDLAVVDSAQRLEETVASALGVIATADRALTESIGLALGARWLLLLLDNCEHVLEPAAALVDGLLRACSQLRILVTSRESLHVPGEVVWPVPPLELPDQSLAASPSDLGRAASVRLFVERARLTAPDFVLDQQNASLVADVCRQLDGIPLAIELAAARVRALGVDELHARLDHSLRLLVDRSSLVPPRQRTLRASLDWSHALLSEPERSLFARLAVFAGGWTLSAAETVCSGGILATDDVLDLLTRLIDRSLVTVTSGQMPGRRYRFLETVREYATERLVERPEADEVRRKHAEYFCALAVQGERELWKADQGTWMLRLREELGNVHAALEWAMSEAGEVDIGLGLAGALGWFWSRSGLVGDARVVLARLLARGGGPTLNRGWALNGAASLAFFAGDRATGMRCAQEALAIATRHADPVLLTYAFVGKGLHTLMGGDPAEAERILLQGLPHARACGDAPPLYNLLWALAETARLRGDNARAEDLLREALALVKAHGDTSGTGYVLFSLGHLLLARDDSAGAAELFLQSLAVRAPAGDALGVTHCLDALASAQLALGAPEGAVRLFAVAASLRQAIGGGPPPLWAAVREHGLAAARSSLGEDAFAVAWAQGALLSLEAALAEATALTIPPTSVRTV